jgi:hypothetical protein
VAFEAQNSGVNNFVDLGLLLRRIIFFSVIFFLIIRTILTIREPGRPLSRAVVVFPNISVVVGELDFVFDVRAGSCLAVRTCRKEQGSRHVITPDGQCRRQTSGEVTDVA